MSIFSAERQRRTTTIIIRDGGDLAGLRTVTDDASPLSVCVIPFRDIAAVAGTGGLTLAGAYVLVGTGRAYVGESGNVGRRLLEHADDRSKAFATEAYVLAGFERRLDKAAAVHLQGRLYAAIDRAGKLTLQNGTGAGAADLPDWRKVSLDRMFEQALPLLFDAGLHAIWQGPDELPIEAVADEDDEPDDDGGGPMEIGVSVAPPGVQESELSYCNIWARGYEHQGRFVVAAGSEIRMTMNASVNEHTRRRREQLLAGAVEPIPGVEDRRRLTVAVAFPSRAIAAKVLCGAHVGSGKWRPWAAPRSWSPPEPHRARDRYGRSAQ